MDLTTHITVGGLVVAIVVPVAGSLVWTVRALIRNALNEMENRVVRLETKFENGIKQDMIEVTGRLDKLVSNQMQMSKDLAFLNGKLHAMVKDENGFWDGVERRGQ